MTIILNQKVTSSQSTTDMELQSGGGGGVMFECLKVKGEWVRLAIRHYSFRRGS